MTKTKGIWNRATMHCNLLKGEGEREREREREREGQEKKEEKRRKDTS
jgi:hypothetical protein